MSGSLVLGIGGLSFAAIARQGIDVIENDPLYANFVGSERRSPADVIVDLRIDPAPDVSSLPVLFDTGQTWTAFADDADLVLRLRCDRQQSSYLWTVRLIAAREHLDVQSATVHCGPRLIEKGGREVRVCNPLHYPLDQLLIMLILATRRGCVLHAAGIARRGRGVAFVGRSGAGKTTLMRLLEDRSDLERLSDDRLVIRLDEDIPRVFGTPWAGEGLVAANLGADLGALVFLHKDIEQSLRPIGPDEAMHRLLPTTSIPWFDEDRLSGCLETLDALVRETPAFDLHFRMEPSVGTLIDDLF